MNATIGSEPLGPAISGPSPPPALKSKDKTVLFGGHPNCSFQLFLAP